MIKLNKPKFWDLKQINFISLFLYPLSLITLFAIFLKKRFSRAQSFKIPIICIGNIYIGGTGKTPLAILLAKELEQFNIKSAILRKYYESHIDEYNQIKNNYKNLIINKSRIEGIKDAEKSDYHSVILDDGLQDYNIKKDLSIACFHQNQLVGNGLVLPAGPLRENLKSLKNIDIVIINGTKDRFFEEKLLKINKNLEFFYVSYKPSNIEKFKNSNILAIAGIANPENFFQILEENNLKIKEKLIFPDHYKFSKNEMKNIFKKADNKNLKIIMTEKDFFKLNDKDSKKVDYLKVILEIDNKEKLINKLRKLYV